MWGLQVVNTQAKAAIVLTNTIESMLCERKEGHETLVQETQVATPHPSKTQPRSSRGLVALITDIGVQRTIEAAAAQSLVETATLQRHLDEARAHVKVSGMLLLGVLFLAEDILHSSKNGIYSVVLLRVQGTVEPG